VLGLIRERIRAYNTAVDAIAATYGCFVVHYWDVAAMDDDRLWADDRLHLSPAGHELAAASAREALGLDDDTWRTPLVPPPRVGPVAAGAGHARWFGAHAGPWLARRARGTSSGDGVTPKHPTWVHVSGGAFVPSEVIAEG